MNISSLTNEQKIAYLAEKVIGWFKSNARDPRDEWVWSTENVDQREKWTYAEDKNWNPLTDWNHWRQVEEKMMEGDSLLETEYNDELQKSIHDTRTWRADLPTRVDALISALESLK